jgi:histidinol-phosphatase (PHP family)
MHTRLCRHATGSVEEYVESARRLGISEIAFTDHLPLPDGFDNAHRMKLEELDQYANWITGLRSRYPDMIIRHGIEADYYKGFENYTEKILGRYDFDVVIMSVHFVRHWSEGNWVFNYSFPAKPIAAVYADYIDTVIEGMKTGLFDILGHIDLIKKPGDSLIDIIPDDISRLLEIARQAAITIEINTSGYRKSVAEPYPGLDWLSLLKESNIPITVGSDAHAPDQVGLNFKAVYEEIKRRQFETLSTYEKRRRLPFKII